MTARAVTPMMATRIVDSHGNAIGEEETGTSMLYIAKSSTHILYGENLSLGS